MHVQPLNHLIQIINFSYPYPLIFIIMNFKEKMLRNINQYDWIFINDEYDWVFCDEYQNFVNIIYS